MAIVPVIKASRLVPVLVRLGYKFVRQKGSHAQFEHLVYKWRKVTVPMNNKDLPKKTLLSILKQAGISLPDFLKIIGK